jgi:hypothetical protein
MFMSPEQGANTTHLLCLGCKNTYLLDTGTAAARIASGEIRENETARMGPMHKYTTTDCTSCRATHLPPSMETLMATMCEERRHFEAIGVSRAVAVREAVASNMETSERRDTAKYREQVKAYRADHSWDDYPHV